MKVSCDVALHLKLYSIREKKIFQSVYVINIIEVCFTSTLYNVIVLKTLIKNCKAFLMLSRKH